MAAKCVLFGFNWLSLTAVAGLLLPVYASSGGQQETQEEKFVLREEFQEFRLEISKKLDLILNTLVKDGHFADTFRGLPGDKGERGPPGQNGQKGEQGPPGEPCSNATLMPVFERLEMLEKMKISDGEPEVAPWDTSAAEVIFGLHGNGVKAYSEQTSQVRTVEGSTKFIEGVAYDPRNKKVYYSTDEAIHRINVDGSGDQTVFTSSEYRGIRGIALDWITGNLYGISRNGYLFVCAPTGGASGLLSCKTLLSGQGSLRGIAVNPNAGTIFWTTDSGTIMKASTDGMNSKQIVSGLGDPTGITVDYKSSKLFWVDPTSNLVQSSTLEGRNVNTVLEISGFKPWGIALSENKIYLGNCRWASELRSCTRTGADMRTLYNASTLIQQLTVVAPAPASTRRNHCTGQSCYGICVLTPSSFRCLSG